VEKDKEYMKTTRPKNSWTNEVKLLFLESYTCWNCGQNTADCGHHIFGRGHEEGCEKSALNYAFLCNHKCHLARHGYWMTDEGKKYLFTKTLKYLIDVGYKLKKIDQDFLDKYKLEINKLNIKI